MPENKNYFIACIRFLSVFVAVFVLQYVLYFCIPDAVLANSVYHTFIVMPVIHVINFIFPAEQAYGLANSIRSVKVDLEIVRGCDGSGMLFLLEAAIAVFPCSVRRKISGMLAAFILSWCLNSVRLLVLFYAASFQPELFASLHNFYIPTLLIALSGIFFYAWSMKARHETRKAD